MNKKKNIDNEPGLFNLVREEQLSIQTKLKVMHESFEGIVSLINKLESRIKKFDNRVTSLELTANSPPNKKGLLPKEPIKSRNGDAQALP